MKLRAGIGHDLNNILGVIQMHCDLIARQASNPQAVMQGIQQIEKATQRAGLLIRELNNGTAANEDHLEGHETILIVEGESNLRELHGEAFVQFGYTVLLAESGSAALRILETSVSPVHLIVTDKKMIEMGNNALENQVSLLYPKVKFLCLEQLPGKKTAPIKPTTVISRIRELLDSSPVAEGKTKIQKV